VTDHETAFIRSFVLAEKQARWLDQIGRPKRRSSFLHVLADDRDFDSSGRIDIAPSEQHAHCIVDLLRQRGAGATCYVISEMPALDGRELPLAEALGATVGMGLGSILSCIPGVLAYYEGEGPSHRYIFWRKPSV